MDTVTLNVKDVINSYCFVTGCDSTILAASIIKELKKDNKVIIDFSEIEHCTSYFDILFDVLYRYDLDKPDNVTATGFKDKEIEKSFNNYRETMKKSRIEYLEYLEKHPDMKAWDERESSL